MPYKVLIPDITNIGTLLHDHHAVLARSAGGTVAVFVNNAPAFYVVMPARLAKLLALEEKPSCPGNDVTLGDQFYEGPQAAPAVVPVGRFAVYTAWQPNADFRRQTALWGVALKEPVTAKELTPSVAYWQAEGRVFRHIRRQQRLARSIQIGRVNNGGMPKCDVNSVSELDGHIPPGLRG